MHTDTPVRPGDGFGTFTINPDRMYSVDVVRVDGDRVHIEWAWYARDGHGRGTAQMTTAEYVDMYWARGGKQVAAAWPFTDGSN